MNDIDELMSDYDGCSVPGASVLVLHGDEVVFRKSYGSAGPIGPNAQAGSTSTHYRLASVSKQFTAAAIMTLAEQGKLSYDDSVRSILTALPSWADAITIRHLLTHTSGVIDYEDVMPSGMTGQLSDADVLALLAKQTSTLFPAGSGYRYSNSGYALLALIVEKVSGMTFAQFLRKEIFLPLGMKSTVAHVEGVSTVADRAFGHSLEAGEWKVTDQSTTSAVLGDGGIYSSVDELGRWLYALDTAQSGGRFRAAWEPMVTTDIEGMSYGFGWRISHHQGRRMISHTGETIGFRNAIVRFPDERLSVVVLTNRNEGQPLDLALAIVDRLVFSK